jgi:CDP-diglyceride synthetase
MGSGPAGSGPAGSVPIGPVPTGPRPNGSRWSDLTLRVLSALVLLPVALLCVWAGGYAFLLLVAVAGFVLAREWLGMCRLTSSAHTMFWFPAAMVAISAVAGLGYTGVGLVAAVLGTVATAVWGSRDSGTRPGRASFIRPGAASSLRPDQASLIRPDPASLVRHGPARPGHLVRHDVAADGAVEPDRHNFDGTGHAASDAAGRADTKDTAHASHADRPAWTAWPIPPKYDLALGFVWVGLPATALLWLRADPVAGLPNTLFILGIVWGSDIGAYIVGRLVGGPKLAPTISPGKTWSGAVGGLASAVLAGLAVAACLSPGISPSHVIGPGIVLGIISQAGDLLESALKRHFGVKDSGHIIPGHGGLLDRLDALLAVAPVAALLAFTVGRGVVLWR